MTKWRKTSYSLLITSLLAFASIISASAQTNLTNQTEDNQRLPISPRTQILNPECIVYWHGDNNKLNNKSDNCRANREASGVWKPVNTGQEIIFPNHGVGTGRNSYVELKYLALDLFYRQKPNTYSRFVPEEAKECGFKFLGFAFVLEKESKQKSECDSVQPLDSPVSITFPGSLSDIAFRNKQLEDTETENSAAAFFVSRNREDGETIVGVLANQRSPVLVKLRENIDESVTFDDIDSNETVDQIELDTGEFAFILDDGRFVRGEFSIRRFYEDNPILTVGLLDRPEDIAYFNDLEGEERELFAEIREATRQALDEYPEPGPLEVKSFLYPDLNTSSILQCQVYQYQFSDFDSSFSFSLPMLMCF